MPAGSKVRPKDWTQVIDLFDDGKYSAIWGIYKKGQRRCLAVRWNGGKGCDSFPVRGRYPLWYVEPDFLTASILYALLTIVIHDQGKTPRQAKHLTNLRIALSEFLSPDPESGRSH